METSIIKSLFKWFCDCEILEADSELNVDYLGEDAEQYSIETVPCKTVVKATLTARLSVSISLSLQAENVTVRKTE